jgi:NAD(P)-dependent dehydrogenase (short-subunit alcohol dehydrogenase family)
MSSAGRVFIVTGAGSGIGRKCAELLLQGGASVVALDLHVSEPLADSYAVSGRLTFIEGDASDADMVRATIERAVAAFGRLDGAINAAGITGSLRPILEQDDDGLDRLMAVNIKGVFLATKYEAAAMRGSGGGAIVNIASVYAKGSHENMVLYGATKHAVAGFTMGAAVELAKYSIRVNAVAPGPILTPFIGQITPKIEQAVVRGIPQQRIGEPAEVAHAALWLCSAEATYITGALLTIDGGQSAKLSG